MQHHSARGLRNCKLGSMLGAFGKQEIDVTAGAVDLLSCAIYVRQTLQIATAPGPGIPPPEVLRTLSQPSQMAEEWIEWWHTLAHSVAMNAGNGIEVQAGQVVATLDRWSGLRSETMSIVDDALAWAAEERTRLGQAQRNSGIAARAARAAGERPRILRRNTKTSLRIAYLPAIGAWFCAIPPSLVLIGEGSLRDHDESRKAVEAGVGQLTRRHG